MADLFQNVNGWWKVRLFVSRRYKTIKENAGSIIALVAAVAAVYSVKAQMDSVDAQIKSMQTDQRPYVSLSKMKWKTINNPTGVPTMFVHTYITLVSVGRTPAMNVRVHAICKVVDVAHHRDQLTFNADAEQTTEAGDCVGPDDDSEIKTDDLAFVRLYGEVYYHDIATPKTVHHTPFCFENEVALQFHKNKTGPLRYCTAVLPSID